MNWFRKNRLLGAFRMSLGVCLAGAGWFLFSAKSDFDEAATRFNNTATEFNRLERLAPYPSADNLRKMKVHADDYASALGKLKEELKTRVTPPPPLRPNEFQSQLRVALNAIADRARANRVKLPDRFYFGFDEFVSALPNEAAAPSLGQELLQIEWLMSSLLDAHVDAVTAFRRTALAEERNPPGAGTPSARAVASKLLQRNVVETTFVSTPAAARKVINQIAGANQPFCIIRVLHVRNEKEKGPPREENGDTPATSVPAQSPRTKATPAATLNFIVGHEKVETTAKIEFVRFVL